ncbi:MAG: transporter [Defluviitaleaceae bacterium]|nr:transporter [Defluviitaleaceae bacterium]
MIRNRLRFLEKVANAFEFGMACLLLVVITVKLAELSLVLAGFEIIMLDMDFKEILSALFILVIGIELAKMLIKHTPESVIDVLLFTIARQLVMYHDRPIDNLIGVIAIAGLFAAKKYFMKGDS